MVSNDLKELMDLIYSKKFSIRHIELTHSSPNNINEPFKTEIYLQKDDKGCNFLSHEEDVFFLASSFNKTIDNEGNSQFMRYHDLEKYYSDIMALIDIDDTKRQSALKNVQPEDYDPEELLKLIKEYLSDKNRTSEKYILLKSKYFDICAYLALYANQYVLKERELRQERPNYAIYSELIYKMLGRAFQTDKNAIKNYLKYIKYIDIEFFDALMSGLDQKQYHRMQYKTYAASGKSLPIKAGVMITLDILRRYNEVVKDFFNALRIGIEIANGIDPKLKMTFQENVNIIRSNKEYSPLADYVNPIIRNSESHISTEIDEKGMKINFFDKRNRKKKLIGECQIKDLQTMIIELDKSLLPALFFSFNLQEITSILLVLHSPEYRISLLGIDNKA